MRDDSPFAGALHVGDELISINGDASSCSNAKRERGARTVMRSRTRLTPRCCTGASAQCLKEEVLELVVQTPLGKSKKGNSMNLRSSSRKK